MEIETPSEYRPWIQPVRWKKILKHFKQNLQETRKSYGEAAGRSSGWSRQPAVDCTGGLWRQ